MDKNFMALVISELLPRRGRPGRRRNGNTFIHGSPVLIGDHEDIWLCENLYYAVVDHNWHSQHGYIRFTDGEKFWYYNQTINGKKAFLFRATEENLNVAERKDYERKFSDWTNADSTPTIDVLVCEDLVLDSVGKENEKPVASRKILDIGLFWRSPGGILQGKEFRAT